VRQIETKAVGALLDLIHRYQKYGSAMQPAADVPTAAVPHVCRRVHASGQIMVAKQTISLGPRFRGQDVTVLVEDTQLRVLHEDRQIAVVRRRHDHLNGKIYGLKG